MLVSANQHVTPYPVYPIGLSYITTYLKKRLPELEIKIFDFNISDMSDLIEILEEFNPCIVGVSLRNVDDTNSLLQKQFIERYTSITDNIKAHSQCILVIGGSGFSIFPKIIFDKISPDYGIHGEGEESFFNLIVALMNQMPVDDIKGLVFRNNGEICINKKENCLDHLEVTIEENIVDYYWHNSGMIGIQTKRGCPYDCIYCTYPIIEGKKVRVLDPDKVVFTLENLYYKKGIDYIFFTDSVFNIRNENNIELAKKIIDSGIKIKWGAYFSPSKLNHEILSLFKQSGLTHIEFGTESFSDIQLKNYHKQFSVDEVIRVSEITDTLGIYSAHFLILGGFGETEETLTETFENSKRIKNSVYFPSIGMRIYPGTPLHQLTINESIISSKEDLLEVKYYISDQIEVPKIKEKALNTGKRWIFPDEDLSDIIIKMRIKNRKGPLWEYLIY